MAVPGTLSLGGGGGVPGTFSLPGSSPFVLGGNAGPKKDKGLLGDIVHIADVATQLPENLLKDVGTAAVGFPLGLYAIGKTAVTNPRDLVKYAEGIVKQYEAYYGHDVLHHLWDHPLQPILDGLTVASGGLGAAAKIGEVGNIAKLAQLGERTTLVTRSPLAIHTGEGPVIERLSSNHPISKLRQQVVNKMQRHMLAFDEKGNRKALGYLPGVGNEAKQYGKLIGDEAILKALRESTPMRAYEKAWGKLSKDEKIALSARSMDIHPTNLKAFWKDTSNGDDLTDQVQALMLEPTSKMVNAEAEARALSQAGANLLKRRGALSEESEIDRPGRFKQQVSDYLGHPIESLHDDPYYIPHTTEAMWRKGSHPLEQVGGGKAEPKRLGSTKQNLGELFASGKLDLANDVLGPEFLRRVKWLKFHGIHEGLKRGAVRVTWDDLHQMHPSGQPPKGYDFLRTSVTHRASDSVRVRLRKAQERNRRQPNFDNAQAVQRLERELYLFESGRRADPASYGKQKIPFSVRGEGEHGLPSEARYDPADIPDSTDLQHSPLSEGFTTDQLAHAYADEAGHYYLIPKATARAATGEFTRMSDFMYQWARRPLRIWRAALLGLRPAFFVNNLIGNSLMYTMKRGGTGAIRDLFMALRESHTDTTMKRLLHDAAVPDDVRLDLTREFFPTELELSGPKGTALEPRRYLPGTTQAERVTHTVRTGAPGETTLPAPPGYGRDVSFYREFFPEQMSGTLGLTQSPSTEGLLRGATGKVGRGWEKTTGALPTFTSKVAEEGPRMGLIRNFIRTSPEFKKLHSSMPREARSFEGTARRLLKGEGGEKLQRLVSQQVDESLGNYTRLSPIERNALRNVFPFYAWYRAIVKTSFHLAVDNPLRAQILFKLGQIGAETALNQAGLLDVPSYLQGAIPLGEGPHRSKRVIATQSLNPWATLAQLVRGSTEDLTDLGMNPFLVGALEAFRDNSSGPGGTIKGVTVQTLVGSMLSSIVKGLPPAAQVAPKGPSRLYPNRGYPSAWEAWAGLPLKEYNPLVAAEYAKAGQ